MRDRFALWVLGLGVGSWIGRHTALPIPLLDWVVLVAFAIGSTLALLYGFERREGT